VMPYESTVFSAMTTAQLAAYRAAWRNHVQRALDDTQPDIIHSHHIWLLSALLRDLAPHTPIVTQCHATGFRQLALCPHLADEVRTGCARIDHFAVLHSEHAAQLAETLNVPRARVHVVGAGFREELFHARNRHHRNAAEPGRLVYIGKYSAAKGLPWLLDAVERLSETRPGLTLHVAGSGAGEEAAGLRQRMETMAPLVVLHGQLPQPELAELLRTATVCVLPSFYEGVPLVLAEAYACGCRLVSTALPGVEDQLAPHLGAALHLIPPPRLRGVDTPEPDALPAFVYQLTAALDTALTQGPVTPTSTALEPFTWTAVYRRVEQIWTRALTDHNDAKRSRS
ncbi:MAG: glycosyltransferase family 4 protein, partial [bacterium]